MIKLRGLPACGLGTDVSEAWIIISSFFHMFKLHVSYTIPLLSSNSIARPPWLH